MSAASSRNPSIVLLGVAVLVLLPRTASAEGGGVGAGIRFSFVRGSVEAEPSQRYSGGQLRLFMSLRSALELSLDYRSVLNDTLTARVKDYPIQVSMLLYPVRTRLSPYVLGGLGWYSQRVDSMEGDVIQASVTTRKVGYHAGLGGEVRLGARLAVHLDYRYTFIHFGGDNEASGSGAIPIPGLGGLQEKLKLSHEGSMWTTGLTVYF